MLIPLYGVVRGDSLVLLALAQSSDALATVAENLVRAADVRLVPGSVARVIHEGRSLDLHATVEEQGLAPLDLIEVVMEEP